MNRYKSPKGGTKRDFALFASKIQLPLKKVCYKVSLCENFERQCCSYIIPISNGPKMDCGQRPHLNKICAQSDTSSEVDNALFIELQMTPVRYPKSPQRVAQNEYFYVLRCLLFVARNRRQFKFGMQIDHSKSQPRTTNCPKNGRGHVTWSTLHFKTLNIPLE